MNVNSDSNSVSLKSNELNADQNENEPFEFSKLVDKVMTQKKILSKCCSSLTSDVFDKTIYPKFIIVNPQWVKDKEKVLENSKVIDLKEFALALEQEVGKEVESANQKLKDEIVKVETKNMLLEKHISQVRKEFVSIKRYEELKRLYEEAIEKEVKEIEMKPVNEEMTPKMNIETTRKIVYPSSPKTHDEFSSSATTTFKYLKKSADGPEYYEISPDLVPIRICNLCHWFEIPTNRNFPKHLKTQHNLSFDRKNPSYFNSLSKNVLMKSEAFQMYRRSVKTISISEIEENCYDLPEDHVLAQICLICRWFSVKFCHVAHFADSHRPLYNDGNKSSAYSKMIVIKKTKFKSIKNQFKNLWK